MKKQSGEHFEMLAERAERVMHTLLSSTDEEVREWSPAHLTQQAFMYAALFEQTKEIQADNYWQNGMVVGVEVCEHGHK